MHRIDLTEDAQPGSVQAGVQSYQRRAKIGAIALAARTALMQFVILGGTIVLARHLTPAEFGVFAMVQFVVTLLTLFGDGGLGGALIQRAEAPSEEALSSVFWAQMAFAWPVFGACFVVGPHLSSLWPDIPPGSTWLLIAVASNFLLTSARVVPTLLLERELLFVRVSILETVSSTAFYLIAAVLALRGYGTSALALGVFAQGLIAFLFAFALRPWRPRLSFDWPLVRELLHFGLPFQARPGLLFLTNSVIPVIGGSFFGSRAVGMLTWALETAFFPLTFVYILSRVSFPLYSRLKGSPEEFAIELSRYVRAGLAITFFLSGMFVGLAPQLTEIIYSAQWLDAVPSLRVFALAICGGVFVQLLAPAFDSLGRPRPVMVWLGLGVLVVWGLSYALSPRFGELAFALAFLGSMSLGVVVLQAMARGLLPPIPVVSAYGPPLVAGGAIAALGWVGGPRLVHGPFSLVLAVVAEIALYLGALRLIGPKSFRALVDLLPRRGHA
jgi:O-antigen/teichoic acid export membrane protein